MENQMNEDPVAARWAGIGVAFSGFALVVTIGLYAGVLGSPTPSDPGVAATLADRGNHIIENWRLASGLWVTEVFLFVLLAVSALILATESRGGVGWLPRRAAWAAVGVGAILQAAMYSFMIGGYPAAIEAVETTPALFSAFNGAAFFLFYLGNATIFLGFGGAYATEGLSGHLVSRRVGWFGSITCLLGMALLLLLAVGIVPLAVAAPFALITHFFMGYLGIALYRSYPTSGAV